MSTHVRHIIALLFVILEISSCRRPQHEDIKNEDAHVTRLDIGTYYYNDMDSASRQSFRDSFKNALAILVKERPVSDSAMSKYAQSKAIKMFVPDIMSRYTCHDSIETILGRIRLRQLKILPELAWPRMYGIVSPYNQSIIVSDSIMLIGINHYLGADYEAYSYFDEYLRRVKNAGRLPYDIVEALLRTQIPFIDEASATTLNRMLYEGAIIKAMEQLIPDFDLVTALGYDRQQMDAVKSHETEMWKRLISQRLLFSSDPAVADRLLKPAPATTIINTRLPGRAARFIGYRIADAYMREHREYSLSRLLSPEFYNSPTALVESCYSPR